MNIKSENIFVQWPLPGPIRGLFEKKGFFNNEPELGFVTYTFKKLGGKLQRKISIGIADAQTGEYIKVNQNVGNEKIPYYVVASSSVPGFFDYLIEGKRVYVDGFTVDNLNLRGGIEECQKMVSDDSKIIVDIIMTNPLNVKKYNVSAYNPFVIYQRASQLTNLNNGRYYLFDIMKEYPNINWRYLIYPKDALPNIPFVPLVLYI